MGAYRPQLPISGWYSISSDSNTIGKLAAEHLLDRGFTNFAYCGFDHLSWSRDRGEGFGKRVAKAGFETNFYEQPRTLNKRLWENEQNLMADWLKSLPKPVGLMACNDDRAQQVIEACKMANLRVPEQIAIVGVDNDEFVCDLSETPISSIPLNNEQAGYEAAQLLHRVMAGEKIRHRDIVVQPTHVVTRQSTDILAIEDSDVAVALRYIRQHSRDIIQVNDVLNVVTVGRRTLEEKFHKIIGRSIYAEITRVRINQISRAIVETNQPISQIASLFGYSSTAHIARYFRRVKGMTPLEYRKQYGQR